MEKPANAEQPILDLIRRRWSPLAFDPRPIERPVLLRLFEAARWAASSFNEQPWTYLIGSREDDPEQLERIAGALVPQNGWAKNAPVLALSVARMTFTHSGAPNRVAFHDVGMATENLVLEAMSLGIFVHQMAGFDVGKAKELSGIPEGYEPVAMIALGYPGDPEKLDQKSKEREASERKRKRVGEFVFQGRWGQKPL